MLMPSIFNNSLFDEMMDFPFGRDFFGDSGRMMNEYRTGMMKTDVKEADGVYEVDMELPGYKKEDISANLEKGYLTITAVKNEENNEGNSGSRYIRRERYSGQCSRSFFVGENVRQEDIHARFEDGILKLTVPKTEPAKIEEQKYIAIEG